MIETPFIETQLTEAMHDGTDDLHFDPALFDAAARRNQRRTAMRRAGATTAALAAVAVSAVVVIPHGGTAKHPVVAQGAGPLTKAHTVAFIAKQLKATLADEDGYVITSHLTSAADGTTMTTWLDPTTGARRLQLDNADGSTNTVIGIVVSGGQATITSLDYASHTASTTTEPVAVINASSRLGVNVPTPTQIRSEISASDLVDQGVATVNGQPAEQYHLLTPQPAGSEIWAKGTDVELYVDTKTYRLVRITVGEKNGPLYDDYLTWTPRSAAALATTQVTAPTGFSKN